MNNEIPEIQHQKDTVTSTKQCIQCGAVFTPAKLVSQKYCGPACRTTAGRLVEARKLPPLVPVRCRQCGVEFMPGRRGVKFCSVHCKDDHNNAKKYHENTCQQCGKSYMAASRGSKTCSARCGLLLAGVPTKSLTCVDCGATFRFVGRTSKRRCDACWRINRNKVSARYAIASGRVERAGAGSGNNQRGEKNHAWDPDCRYHGRMAAQGYVAGYIARCYAVWPKACVICGTTLGIIDVHHINGVRSDTTTQNLVPLCRLHHHACHRYKRTHKCGYEDALFALWANGRSKIAELSGNPVAIKIGESEPKAVNGGSQGQRLRIEITCARGRDTAR